MPRKARVLLPNTPHHIVQRGHNRAGVFRKAEDYRYYLATLIEWKQKLGLKLYAYCLMTNHVHLILEPDESVSAVGYLMRRLAGRQTRLVNAMEGRTGSLWEGRYKASPIQSERYLLACSRYVELNPVRAGMVASATDYAWSSYCAKIGGKWPEWLDEDVCYRSLGGSARERSRSYSEYIEGDVNEEEQVLIRTALRRNQLTGDERFIKDVARRLGQRIEFRGRGRPKQND